MCKLYNNRIITILRETSLLKILIFIFLFTNFTSSQSGAIVVTVDGLDFSKILGQKIVFEDQKLKLKDLNCSFEDWDNYLGEALKPLETENPELFIRPFVWERSSAYTDYYIISLRNFLKDQYDIAKTKNQKLIVVAHSWGTFLAYSALSYKYNNGIDPVRCDLLITLGCPLGTEYANKNKIKDPFEDLIAEYVNEWLDALQLKRTDNELNVKKWYNFWNWGDMISGPINARESKVSDLEIFPTGMNESKAHQYRNSLSTTKWHKYNSLQTDGILDNSVLGEKIFQIIRNLLIETDDFEKKIAAFFNDKVDKQLHPDIKSALQIQYVDLNDDNDVEAIVRNIDEGGVFDGIWYILKNDFQIKVLLREWASNFIPLNSFTIGFRDIEYSQKHYYEQGGTYYDHAVYRFDGQKYSRIQNSSNSQIQITFEDRIVEYFKDIVEEHYKNNVREGLIVDYTDLNDDGKVEAFVCDRSRAGAQNAPWYVFKNNPFEEILNSDLWATCLIIKNNKTNGYFDIEAPIYVSGSAYDYDLSKLPPPAVLKFNGMKYDFIGYESNTDNISNNISTKSYNARIFNSYESNIEINYLMPQNLSEGQECEIYDLSNNKLLNGYISTIDGSNIAIEVQEVFNNMKLQQGREIYVEFK